MFRRIVCLLLIFASAGLSAQTLSETWMTSDTLHVYFPQNVSVLNPAFRNNGQKLSEFTDNFHRMKDTPGSKVRSVLIVSGASPEGRLDLNRKLSDSRARAVLDFLLDKQLLDPSEVEVESRGVDWKGLGNLLQEASEPYAQDVLRILDGPEVEERDGRRIEVRQQSLMKLDEGKVWTDIYDKYFPNLRGTMVMIVWDIRRETRKVAAVVQNPEPEQVQPEPAPEPVPEPAPAPAPVPAPAPKPAWTFNMVVKTNLLYDAASMLNLGVEFGLYKGLTLNVEYMHNPWIRANYAHWYRVHGAEFGLKYYFNKEERPFAPGHHVGLSAQMLTFDLTGIMVDAEPWKCAPMISYGYTLPIRKRLNLDFEVGAGVLIGDVYKYNAVDQLRLLYKVDKAAFVPKLGVTLQYLIGKNNYNERRK